MLQEIASVLQTSLSVADPVTLAVPTTNWRVIRQPRVLAGEEPLNLTNPIVIDLGTSSAPLSQNVPLRAAQSDRTIPPVFFREILFSPTGSVIGQGTASNDKIILWVHDGSLSDPTQGEPVLIAIQISTGFIGAYPVDIAAYNNNGDPYSNTHDPHASGL